MMSFFFFKEEDVLVWFGGVYAWAWVESLLANFGKGGYEKGDECGREKVAGGLDGVSPFRMHWCWE